jgi:hypothetical protein
MLHKSVSRNVVNYRERASDSHFYIPKSCKQGAEEGLRDSYEVLLRSF